MIFVPNEVPEAIMHMRPHAPCSQCAGLFDHCRKMMTHLNLRKVTLEEFGYNLAISLVQTCEACTQAAIDALPDEVAEKAHNYLQTLLVPADFMIDPQIFIVGKASDEQIEEMKVKLRPKYVYLLKSLNTRVQKCKNSASNP